MTPTKSPSNANTLEQTRAYLSGPMDFVGSRVIEKYLGWRAILTPVLQALGTTVLDPWNKPAIRGHGEDYGNEGVFQQKNAYSEDFWVNPETRARFERDFWETVHIDLRMTDIADFLVAFVPTNIYSVGTVNEIVLARTQFKPVLLVSPPVLYSFFPELDALSPEVKNLLKFYGLKENPEGLPSQWYGNIVGGHNLFDGFGWENLEIKDDSFYSNLFENVLALARPMGEDTAATARWESVAAWTRAHEPFQSLRGGVLESLRSPDEAEWKILATALRESREKQRRYFWYNQPYKPKRPLLYHLLSIAAGHIPQRTRLLRQTDDQGKTTSHALQSLDDDWLILSAASPKNTPRQSPSPR
jgi:hypothetical protein